MGLVKSRRLEACRSGLPALHSLDQHWMAHSLIWMMQAKTQHQAKTASQHSSWIPSSSTKT